MSYILGQKKIAQMIGVRSDTPIISPTHFYESVEERDNDTDNRIIGDLAVIEDKGPIPAPDVFANVAELNGLISKGLKTVVNRDFIPQYENYVYNDGPYPIYVTHCLNGTYSAEDVVKYVQSIVTPLDENGNVMDRSQLNQGDRIFGGAILTAATTNEGPQDMHFSALHVSPSLLNLESFTHITFDLNTVITIDKTHYDENGYLLNEYILNIDEESYTYLPSPDDTFLEFSKIYQQQFNATVELKVGDKFNELRFDKMLYHLYDRPFTDDNPMLPLFKLSEGDTLSHELLLFKCDSTTGIPNINGNCFITVMVKIEGIGEKTIQKLTVIGSSHDIPTGFAFGEVTSDPVIKEWNNLTIKFDSEATVEEIVYVPSDGAFGTDWTKHLILAPPIEGTKGVKSILNPERKYIDFKEGGGSTIPIVQTTGDSITDVMSQKAVTDELNKVVKPMLEVYIDSQHALDDRLPVVQDEIFKYFGGQSKFESMISWFKNTNYFGIASISIGTNNLIKYSGIVANQLIYMPPLPNTEDSELFILVYPNPALYNITETINLRRAKEGQWTGTCSRNLGIVNKVMVGMEYYTYPSIELADSLYQPLLDYTGNLEIELNMLWPSTTKLGGGQKPVYSRTFTGTTPEFTNGSHIFFKPLDGLKLDSLCLIRGQIGDISAGDVVPTNTWSISPSVSGFWVAVGDQTNVANLTNKPYCITVMYTKD